MDKEQIEQKAKELGQKYFPNVEWWCDINLPKEGGEQ